MSSSAPPSQFQPDVLRTPEAPLSKAAACPKKTRIKLKKKKAAIPPILGRKNEPRLPNERYQKLQPHAAPVKSSSACASPTTSLTAVATTWTSAPDETLAKSIMSSTSTAPSFSDLASLIYSSFILDHLKSYSNFELNLHKNLFRKFYYPQLISFLDTALSSQTHAYKSLDLVISSALCFLGF